MINNTRSKDGAGVLVYFLSTSVLSTLLVMTLNAITLQAHAQQGQGIDIRFDGKKLLTDDADEEKTGKSLILQGSVNKSSQFSAPSVRPTLQMEHPIQDTFSGRSPVIQRSLFGSDSMFNDGPTPRQAMMTPQPSPHSAPASADDIAAYLRKMRGVLQNYQSTAMSDIFHGGSRVNMQNVDPSQVRGDTEGMIDEIRSITPPKVLASQHYKLADALSAIRNLLAPDRSNPLAELNKITPAMTYLNHTMENYHAGVKNVIAQYRLSESLDPLGNENQADDQKLRGAFDDLSQDLLQRESTMANGSNNSSNPGQAGGGNLQGLTQLLGGNAANTQALGGLLGNSGGNLQGLGSLLGGQGGNLQNLTRMLGNSGAGGSSGDQPQDSGSIQTQDSGSAPNMDAVRGDLNSLRQLMQGGGN